MYLITSDSHFGHKDIVKRERSTRFDDDIQLHDNTILSLWEKWARKLKSPWDTFYFLGDLCAPDKVEESVAKVAEVLAKSPCRKVMVRGNHDKKINTDLLLTAFDEVSDYPIFISNRIVLSHYPQAVYRSQVNIHGHTHGMDLYDNNHICASIHVAKYKPITEKDIVGTLGKVGKWDTHFLYEPWAQDYRLTQGHIDAIADADGRIDLSASRINHMTKAKITSTRPTDNRYNVHTVLL